jgi:hypothetical protein
MIMKVNADVRGITSAIDDFRGSYHEDFRLARSAAQRYSAQPDRNCAIELAHRVGTSLRNWGADRRRAPAMRPDAEIATFLSNNLQSLKQLAGLGERVAEFAIDTQFRSCPGLANVAFDRVLLNTLSGLSSGLFRGNRSVTYPMKALLLITGLTPALDSQVRRGLRLAGFKGVDRTQFLLPRDPHSTDGKKISRLPFVIGECFRNDRETLIAGVRASRHPELENEIGRLFDVLIFMSAAKGRTPVFKMDPPFARWYDVP